MKPFEACIIEMSIVFILASTIVAVNGSYVTMN